MNDNSIKLIITSGEPAGIGIDLCLQIDVSKLPKKTVILADINLVKQRATLLKIKRKIRQVDIVSQSLEMLTDLNHDELLIHHIPLNETCQTGVLNASNSSYVLEQLTVANDLCLKNIFDSVLTLPIHKEIINSYLSDESKVFTGHTEFFQEKSNSTNVLMMLACHSLKVALLTTHIPVRKISSQITKKKLTNAIELLQQNFNKYQLCQQKTPRIAVLGLNPHSGEGGYIGNEEQLVIDPVIQEFKQKGFNITGPLSADTAFVPSKLSEFDVYLGMYHDQVLPVLKHIGFHQAVNVTLGLPYLRVSVDHGTALDLAGTGKVDSSSFEYVLKVVQQMYQC